MKLDQIAYYERRARQETEAAAAGSQPETASAHRSMAAQYEAHVRQLRAALEKMGANASTPTFPKSRDQTMPGGQFQPQHSRARDE